MGAKSNALHRHKYVRYNTFTPTSLNVDIRNPFFIISVNEDIGSFRPICHALNDIPLRLDGPQHINDGR
jgi:hypothetical protein